MAKISSLNPASSTPAKGPGFPLHKLTPTLTKMFLISNDYRRNLGTRIVDRYKEAAGIVSGNNYLIARVERNGTVEVLPPPHARFKNHQLANQPRVDDCACARFTDPENGVPWREIGSKDHHPMCEFNSQCDEGKLLAVR